MAVLQMQKLCICALKKDRKSLMEFLQAAGVLELTAEEDLTNINRILDLLDADDDVQEVFHNWDE